MAFSFSTTKKTDEPDQPPALPVSPAAAASGAATPRPRPAAVRPVDRTQPSMIGPDVTIIGDLISDGEVQIDGEVHGDLHGTHIVVGERARIAGGIAAEEVVVRGWVEGAIRGRKIMLQSSSHVEGDVHHNQLAIEQGAYFEGKSRRTEDPLAGVKRPALTAKPIAAE